MRPGARVASVAVLLLALLLWTTLTPSATRATDPSLCSYWSDLYQVSGSRYHFESTTECDEHWNGMIAIAVRGRLVDGTGLFDGFLGTAGDLNTKDVSTSGTTVLDSGNCYVNVGVHAAGTVKASGDWWDPWTYRVDEEHWLAFSLSPFRCPS
jgi:hypothetical protein